MTRKTLSSLFPSLMAVAVVTLAAPAQAAGPFERLSGISQRLGLTQDRSALPAQDQIVVAERQLSLREVAQIIARELPGSILDAELTSQNGRSVYVVRWEPSDEQARGRIVIFVVDAESGRILSRRGG